MENRPTSLPAILEDATDAATARRAFAEVLSVNPHPAPQQLRAWRAARDRFDREVAVDAATPTSVDAATLEMRWRGRWLRADVNVQTLADELPRIRVQDPDRAERLRQMLELRPEWMAMGTSGLFSDDALEILRGWHRTGEIDAAWREFKTLILAKTYAQRIQQFFPATFAFGDRIFRAIVDKEYARAIAPSRTYPARLAGADGGGSAGWLVALLVTVALGVAVYVAIDSVPLREGMQDGPPPLEDADDPRATELMQEINRLVSEDDGSPEARAEIERLLEELRRLNAERQDRGGDDG